MNYEIGDEVEVYIPREENPDHRYHGHQGTVIDILEDYLSELTDTPGRGKIYTVKFDEPSQDQANFRYSDLEPQKKKLSQGERTSKEVSTGLEYNRIAVLEFVSTMESEKIGREVDLEALIDELDSRNELAEINFSNPSMATIRISSGGPAISLYRVGGFQIRGTPDDNSLFELGTNSSIS